MNTGNLADDDTGEDSVPVKKTRAKRGTVAKTVKPVKVVTKENSEATVSVLTATLQNVNNMIAGFMGAQAFMLDDGESRALAESLAGIAKEVEIEISPLNQAIGNAVITFGMIYGLKYAMHKQMLAAAKGEADEINKG